MRRVVLVGLLAGCNQIFGLSQAHEGMQDAGSGGSNVDASCGGVAGCACEQHSECGSMLCAFTVDPDIGQASGATCADATTVAYVVGDAAATGCTQQAPCGTVTEALATGLQYISVTGMIVDNVDIASTSPVSIYGVADTPTIASPGSGNELTVSAAQASVQAADIDFRAPATNTSIGVSLEGGHATLAMLRCTVELNAEVGISQTGSGDVLTLTRSTVATNNAGGIDIVQGAFTLTNDFVINNGNEGNGVIGGMVTGTGAEAGNRFEYNTVAGNIVTTGLGNIGNGLTCGTLSALTIVNSIVSDNVAGTVDNSGGTGGSDVVACPDGTPAQGSSFIGPDSGALAFIDPPSGNYRIGSESVAIGTAKMDGVLVDFDDHTRGPGSADQGASEFKQ